MIYRLNNNYERRNPLLLKVVLAALVFGATLLFGIYNATISRTFAPVAHSIFLPMVRVAESFQHTALLLYATVADTSQLLEENQALKERVASLQPIELERDLLLEQNALLKENANAPQSRKRLHATVLSVPGRSPYDTFLVDAGADQGISRDRLVFAAGSIIGRVAEVYGTTALVKLLSSPGEEYEVRIGASKIPAKALGRGGGNFEVTLPRGADVKEGDPISIPSVSSVSFGVVEKVGLGSSGTFQKILFKNPFNLYEVTLVDINLE